MNTSRLLCVVFLVDNLGKVKAATPWTDSAVGFRVNATPSWRRGIFSKPTSPTHLKDLRRLARGLWAGRSPLAKLQTPPTKTAQFTLSRGPMARKKQSRLQLSFPSTRQWLTLRHPPLVVGGPSYFA